MLLTTSEGSCPNRQQQASSVKWQTGCWEHFHQSQALIPLQSPLLFIFRFASSLSHAFEIFPHMMEPVTLSQRRLQRVGKKKKWAYSRTNSPTLFNNPLSIPYYFLPSSFPPSVTYFMIYPPSPHFIPFIPPQALKDFLWSWGKNLVWVTDS